MQLRDLLLKDAPLMLEWMHDGDVVCNLNTDFMSKTIEDCEVFIIESETKIEFAHFAIASNDDEYMGTVSLKHINKHDKSAEFAITMRRKAMGYGYAWYGMEEIIKKAFNEFGLECVYWCVSRKNERAVRFYDKHNFHEAVDISKELLQRYNNDKELKWYSVLKGDLLDLGEEVAGCKIIRIKTIPTVNAGELSFFESNREVPFDIKRIYYISKVPEGVRRGFHAHKKLKQVLFCPYGKIQLELESVTGREVIELSDPSVGIVIDGVVWREMLWLQRDSVLCVAASDYYDENDYIREYEEFKRYIKK